MNVRLKIKLTIFGILKHLVVLWCLVALSIGTMAILYYGMFANLMWFFAFALHPVWVKILQYAESEWDYFGLNI